MSTSFYDVVVIGTQLPGILLAALCAKRGYRVVVLGDGVHRRLPPQVAAFPVQQQPFWLEAIEPSPVARAVLDELSLSLEVRNRSVRAAPAWQVVLPHARIDVWSDRDKLRRELALEFGEAAAAAAAGCLDEGDQLAGAIAEFLATHPPLPPIGWRQRRQFERLCAQHPVACGTPPPRNPLAALGAGDPIRAALLAPVVLSTLANVDSPPRALPLARRLSILRRGVSRFRGGIEGFYGLLVQKIRDHSSDWRPDVSPDGFLVRRGRIVEVLARRRQESIGCRMVVCNTVARRFFHLIAAEHQHEAYHAALHRRRPTHFRFVLSLGLHADGVPEMMADDVFVVGDPSRPLEDDNALWLQVHRPPGSQPARLHAGSTRRQGAPGTERVALTVTARMRASATPPSVRVVEEMTHRVLVRLRETVLPFLDASLEVVWSPWTRTDPLSGRRQLDPYAVTPIYGDPLEHTLDAGILAVDTAYKNVLVCNESTFPGFGQEGAFLAAHRALDRVDAALARRVLR